MCRFHEMTCAISFSDDVDQWDDEREEDWNGCCEDPYDDEEEENEREWCD